jgi:cytochrome c-type biogenesis protein CcmH/NrfF
VEILLWLVPSGVVLVIAMVWAAWAGRPRREDDRSTGIAVRPSRSGARPGDRESTRRTA